MQHRNVCAPTPSEWSPWQKCSSRRRRSVFWRIRAADDRDRIDHCDHGGYIAWTDRFAALDRDPQETFARWQALPQQ